MTLATTLRLLAALLLASAVAPAPAAAYIDPISGSIILQVLAALVLGVVLTAKRFWASLRSTLRRLLGRTTG